VLWKLKKDVVGGALQLMVRWLCKAAAGQRESEWEVMTISAPLCLVVFVQGIQRLAEVQPLVRVQKEGAVAHVMWNWELNAGAFLTVVSPE
jgi:hypothetical protein